MQKQNLRLPKSGVRGTRSYANGRRPLPSVPACKSRQRVVSVSANDSLPSFTFRVTAKQATSTKLRLDTFLAAQVAAELVEAANAGSAARAQDVSRAKIQSSIAAGLVRVNGRAAVKPSQQLRPGDSVVCSLLPPTPVQALPEAIPLDIKYEDNHVMVVNKPAGMVVHIAPGHYTGTLVNALLHHCALPAMNLDLDPDLQLGMDSSSPLVDELEDEDEDEDEVDEVPSEQTTGVDSINGGSPAGPVDVSVVGSSGSVLSSSSIRPGIVHRIDKGTSGLLVVAKTELALTRLQAQFKARTVDRLYESITVGCPSPSMGRVESNIGRDPRDRKRMAAAPYGSGRGRTAGSSYTVVTPLASGGAALVRWKLDTGRTHQIRVHAKHVGHPLLGDDMYGGTAASALAAVARSLPADTVRQVVAQLGRPALHARTLGFSHPVTGERLGFEQPPPEDFLRALVQLGLGREHLEELDMKGP